MKTSVKTIQNHIIEEISQLEDENLILQVNDAIRKILDEETSLEMPSNESLLSLAKAGIAQLEAGQSGSWKEMDDAFERGLESGLSQRRLDGLPDE